MVVEVRAKKRSWHKTIGEQEAKGSGLIVDSAGATALYGQNPIEEKNDSVNVAVNIKHYRW